MKKQQIQRPITWLLFSVTGLYMITGFGISQARTVTALTFGILNKVLCFKIHDLLWLPFTILLFLHMLLSLHWLRGSKTSSLNKRRLSK